MLKLLITGFDPFGGESLNPAWEAVMKLPDTIGNFHLSKLEIPTVFCLASECVLAKAREINPDVILCVGQAGGRSAVTPERIGINLRDARSADNRGMIPTEEPIIPGGPDGIFSTLPVQKMAEAITEAGLPGAVSNSAGTFVCNDTLYSLLYHFQGTPTRVGFVHVPYLPEQGVPSLSLEDSAAALAVAISVL